MISPNESKFTAAEFEIWRNLSLMQAQKFNRQGTYLVGEGFYTATVSKYNL